MMSSEVPLSSSWLRVCLNCVGQILMMWSVCGVTSGKSIPSRVLLEICEEFSFGLGKCC